MLQCLLCLPEQSPKRPPCLNRFPRVQPILKSVAVADRSAGPGCSTVHPATRLAIDRRRLAGAAGACSRPASGSLKHRELDHWIP